MKHLKRISCILLITVILTAIPAGCSDGMPRLDPQRPVTITVWHAYGGAIMNAFEAAVTEFNETEGARRGVIVESIGFGHINEVGRAVMASARREIGSRDMPNIFASYVDVVFELEQLDPDLLVDLSDYFTERQQREYVESFIEAGRIGLNGELRVFPVAIASEVLLINETDWLPFASANNLMFEDLSTMEGVARVAQIYYNWSGGKAFFGRDAMANFFINASKQFGTEIFYVESGEVTINVNAEVMRRIWDYYYVPYISGYYLSFGRFRSDDARVGDIIAYVASTASASFFPTEVTSGGQVRPITAKVLPPPIFEGGTRVMVQQGPGMVVTSATPEQEYASLIFLKWFTEAGTNIQFAALSGYIPVKRQALDYDLIRTLAYESGIYFSAITDDTLRVTIESAKIYEMYSTKAFRGRGPARVVLERNLQDKAAADREAVISLINGGAAREAAIAQFNTQENFNNWLEDLTNQLNEAVS